MQIQTEDEKKTHHLIRRIAELEVAQKDSRNQIDDLRLEKTRLKQMLDRLQPGKKISDNDQELNKILQQTIDSRDKKQQKLREAIEASQLAAQFELEKLRTERDAALEIAENQQENGFYLPKIPPTFWLWLLFSIMLGGIVLFFQSLFKL